MSWTCPHCGTVATLQTVDVKNGKGVAVVGTAAKDEGISIHWSAVKCPRKTCGQFSLDLAAFYGNWSANQYGDKSVGEDVKRPVGIGNFRFEPRVGTPLSVHAPTVVKDDYEEAYLIKDLSPKAAATLCRRALQGMIRDFYGVRKPTLHAELEEIRQKCDAELFDAMMGLKGIGNIGAHPEKDISLIVDVEEGEVETLLELLRILDKEWYVARASRSGSLVAVKALAAAKNAIKSASAVALPAPPSAS